MYDYRCTIVRVIDGDTVECDIDLGLHIHCQRKVRLYGINAHEITGAMKEAGLAAKVALEGKLGEGPVIIRTILDKHDKYGRLLGIFYVADQSVNAWLIANGHAVSSFSS